MTETARYSRLEHQPTQIEQLRREFETRVIEQDRRLCENIASLDRLTMLAHAEAKIAVDLAREALEKRLDGMNEFRNSLRDQTVNFATREQLDALRELGLSENKSAGERVAKVENEMANWRGRGTMAVALLGVFFTVVQLALHFIGR